MEFEVVKRLGRGSIIHLNSTFLEKTNRCVLPVTYHLTKRPSFNDLGNDNLIFDNKKRFKLHRFVK